MAGTMEKGGEQCLLSSVPGAREANQNSVLAAPWDSCPAMAETLPARVNSENSQTPIAGLGGSFVLSLSCGGGRRCCPCGVDALMCEKNKTD